MPCSTRMVCSWTWRLASSQKSGERVKSRLTFWQHQMKHFSDEGKLYSVPHCEQQTCWAAMTATGMDAMVLPRLLLMAMIVDKEVCEHIDYRV
jgi:hypothetical protein